MVVGAGAAGGWVAKELCERGASVLLLDAGRAIDAGDFPDPPPPRRPLLDRARSALGGQAVQMRGAAFDSRTAPFFVNDRENPYTTAPGAPFNWYRGRQVGGRMHVWARVALRLSERELEPWPLGREDLDPRYERAEEFMVVQHVSRTAAEDEFVQRAGPERFAPLPLAARQRPGEFSPVEAASATGLLTLRPDTVVRSVLVDEATGMARGVHYVDRATREPGEALAPRVFLCASTFETLRLMLSSRSAAHPSGLGNSSGLLGRGVMDQVVTGIGGPQPGHPGPDDEPYSTAGATGFHVPVPERAFGIQGGIARGPSWYMLAHGEMETRAENRLTLHPRRTDAWGMPIVHLDCSLSAADEAMAAEQLEEMRGLAEAGGLTVRTPPSGRPLEALAFRLARRRLLTRSGAFVPGAAIHELGGAAMGTDPAASVVDTWGRCWDAPNVVVADGASFPAGCWRNTTLTIIALAVRAAERATAG